MRPYTIGYVPEFGKLGVIMTERPHLGYVIKGDSYLECDALAQEWLARQAQAARATKPRRNSRRRTIPCACPACQPDGYENATGTFYCRATHDVAHFVNDEYVRSYEPNDPALAIIS